MKACNPVSLHVFSRGSKARKSHERAPIVIARSRKSAAKCLVVLNIGWEHDATLESFFIAVLPSSTSSKFNFHQYALKIAKFVVYATRSPF